MTMYVTVLFVVYRQTVSARPLHGKRGKVLTLTLVRPES